MTDNSNKTYTNLPPYFGPLSLAPFGAVPPGVKCWENFLTKEMCRYIINYADSRPAKDLFIIDHNNKVQASKGRIGQSIEIDGLEQPILDIFYEVNRRIAQQYRKPIEWFERPYILRYESGGHYETHNDAFIWDESSQQYIQANDRDVSSLLYLNEEFTGGCLNFTSFNKKLQPKTGMLVTFHSGHNYPHAAESVESGVRYAIVCWSAQVGANRVLNGPPKHAILCD